MRSIEIVDINTDAPSVYCLGIVAYLILCNSSEI